MTDCSDSVGRYSERHLTFRGTDHQDYILKGLILEDPVDFRSCLAWDLFGGFDSDNVTVASNGLKQEDVV